MIRRTLLASAVLAVLGGLAGPALADSGSSTPAGERGICVGLTPNNGGGLHGVCVWVPTD